MSSATASSSANWAWLASVPRHWEVVPCRHLCTITTGTGDTQDADPAGRYPFVVRSPELRRARSFDFDTEAVVTVGDGAVGEVFHHVRGKFLAHQRVYVLFNFRGVFPRYFFYYFGALFRFVATDGSARTTVDSVRRWMIADFPVASPLLDEQQAIADYLDRETARIDELIAKQERLTTTLRERQLSVLTSVATEGAAVQVPAKRVLRKMSRPRVADGGVVTAFRDGQVTLRSNRRLGGFTESLDHAGFQGVIEGDLVFHALDGFAGAVGTADSTGNASPVYHVCETVEGHDARYVALVLRHAALSGYLATQAPNVRQRSVDFRNWATFARVPLALAPQSRQAGLVARFNREQREIDALIAKAQRFIELSRERRAALITAAVTGQIDVRERV